MKNRFFGKAFIVLTMFAAFQPSVTVRAAGIPVFDGAAAANFLQQFTRMKEQLDTARSQLTEAQRMYDSVTGVRGFGDLMRNGELRRFLPDDAAKIYDAVQSGSYADISGSIDGILRDEQLSGNTTQNTAKILERERRATATDKAVGKRAYEGAGERLKQIDKLMDEIGQTKDQKAINELQARLTGEQAAIQNEMNKLAMLSQLQSAEQRLIEQQKDAVALKDFDSGNKNMPRIR